MRNPRDLDKTDVVIIISTFMVVQVVLIILDLTGVSEGAPLAATLLPTIILCGFFLIVCLFVLIFPLVEKMIDWVLEKL